MKIFQPIAIINMLLVVLALGSPGSLRAEPVTILSEESPQSDRYHFAIATLIRERNRVMDAIDQSIQVLATIFDPTGGE